MEGEHSMPSNALHHSTTRLRDFGANLKLNCGDAMLFDLLPNIAYGTGSSCVSTLVAPTTIGLQGISVLTFRGGPPIFNE
jgi:hypothetical protein